MELGRLESQTPWPPRSLTDSAMPRLIYSPQSEEDLLEIASYICQDNTAAAERWLERIAETLKLLSEMPAAGRLRPRLAPNLRSFPIGNYVLFYHPLSDGIQLVRVLHGARNIQRKLFRN